ncbi:hypothetical protein [Agarilytica rhodophyticola]|uniref:hypothetical protein n=1 Tax=Agarilytica rhodophyticola TaxID=1737490 RepID=UPI000B347961|nr:hypothetical protein [Agarilytica rhodophyticola]
MKQYLILTLVVNILISGVVAYFVFLYAFAPTVKEHEHMGESAPHVFDDKPLRELAHQISQNKNLIKKMESVIAEQLESQSKNSTNTSIDNNSKKAESVRNDEKTEDSRTADLSHSVMDVFDSVYIDEVVDESWAYTAETSLMEAVSIAMDSTEGMTLHSLECLSSLCKIDYKLNSEGQFTAAMETINHKMGWGSKSYSEYDVSENGEVSVVGFFMREGYDYPHKMNDLY